jgi:hypothetical protein
MLLDGLGGPGSRRKARPHINLKEIDRYASFLQSSSIEKSTTKCYQTGARDYISFCQAHDLSLHPTPLTLSRYVAYSSRSIASAPKYLTGASHFLRELYPDFDENRNHPLVLSTIRGSRKIRADPVVRKLPLRLSHLSSFVERSISTGSYDDLLFATIASCAFYGCHRMGELIVKSDKTLFDCRKIIKRSSLQFTGIYAQYRLPYHKAGPFYRGSDVVFSQHDTSNPVQLLKQYTTLRDARHGPRLSLFLCEDGSLPDRSWFDTKFFSFVSHDFGGHSFRAGGATYFASLGLSDSIIQAIGRWSSSAWKIYIRDNPTVRAEQQLASIRLHQTHTT